MRKRAIRIIGGAVAATAAAVHVGELLAVLCFAAFLLIFAWVVIPAIWSKSSVRRKSAAAVLHQILNIVRYPPR